MQVNKDFGPNENKINYEYPQISMSVNSSIYPELEGYDELSNREIKCICTLSRRCVLFLDIAR